MLFIVDTNRSLKPGAPLAIAVFPSSWCNKSCFAATLLILLSRLLLAASFSLSSPKNFKNACAPIEIFAPKCGPSNDTQSLQL